MKFYTLFSFIILACTVASCTKNKLEEKGFQVNSVSENADSEREDGIHNDSLKFETQPSNVLLTDNKNIRISTIYKVNYYKKDKSIFIGSNDYHYNYNEPNAATGNKWNYHVMPGFQAVYGYNMVNVSHYNLPENKQVSFFEKPVLVKTLYYPSFEKDTLNFKPVSRDYFIVSVYNDDTNKDGFINLKDLRRLFLFDINGKNQQLLVPENYSVFKSEYDSENDYMYVFAQLDLNKNGQKEKDEPIHIFWIDLKNPQNTGQLYQ